MTNAASAASQHHGGLIVMVSPAGLTERGGIGRQMSYLVQAWSKDPAGPRVVVLDPRGGGSLLWSPFLLTATLFWLVWYRLTTTVRVVHINITERGSLPRKGTVLLLARLLRMPTILHLHADLRQFMDAIPATARLAVARTFRMADGVIVLGQLARCYLAETLGVPWERIAVLHNAAPRAERRHRPSAGGPCRLLFLGKISDPKGVPDLLAALARDELRTLDWELALAGSGNIERFQAEADRLDTGARVRFTGWLDPEATAAALDQASCLVLPSHREGLPMVILEALARGLPIVTTAVGSIAEIVENEVSALIVPARDPAALAAALARVISDFPLRCRLAEGSARCFDDRVDIKIYARAMLATYDSLLRPRPSEPAVGSTQSAPILGLRLSTLDFRANAARLIEAAESGTGLHVATVNLEYLARVHLDPAYRGLIESADYLVADGTPLVWLSRLADPRRAIRGRTTGADLVHWLLTEPHPARIALVGGDDPAVMFDRMMIPQGRVVLVEAGRIEADPASLAPLVERLAACRAQFILVGLGVPKQDLVARALHRALPRAVIIAVGGSFDLLAGLKPRAPRWMQRAGLEFLFRLMVEPKRLWRRYLLLCPRVLPPAIYAAVRERIALRTRAVKNGA